MTETNARHIQLPGTYNLRDIGGYATADGRMTRWNTLLRSDSLHAISAAGRQALLARGIQTIIDLRRPAEVARDPNVFAGLNEARYYNIPVFDDSNAARVDHQALDLDELYRNYVDDCQRAFRDVLRVIAHAESGPVLVHCMVGKDRTGVSVALALGAANVPDETIIADYMVSHANLRPLLDEWRRDLVERAAPTERFDRVTKSPAAAMANLLEHLRQRYGGVYGYLNKIGLTAAEVAAIRDKLTS